MIEGILYSLFAGEAYKIVKKGLEKFGPEFEDDEIINAAYLAAQRAYEGFFKKYKKQFGEESRCFLARDKNLETLLNAVYLGGKDPEPADLDPAGFDGAPSATPGAVQYLLASFKEELKKERQLDAILQEKEHHRDVKHIKEKLDRISGNDKNNQTKPILLTSGPVRVVDLVGRAADLKEVGRLIKTSQQLVLVNGLGGVGKTELCKAFFRRREAEYAYSGWVNYVGSMKEAFVAEFTHIPGIDAGEQEGLDDRFNRIMDFLNTLTEDSLLVIDNIDNPGDEDLHRVLSLRCKVLVSSRLKLKGFAHYDLDFLDAAACEELFYLFYKGKRDDGSLRSILELAGYHTLTVELLARTAQNSAAGLADFLHTLQEKGFNLNGVIPEQVETLWNNDKEKRRFFDHLLKVFDLSNLSEEETAILTSLSLLPALYIDMNDLCQWLGLPGKDQLNALVKKGWLRQSGFQVFLHQVMAEVIFYHTKPGCDKCGRLVSAMANNLTCKPGDNPLEKAPFLPYAESILRFIDEDNEELARLANNLSLRYQDLGRLPDALENQLKAIGIYEKVLGEDHPDLATSYNNVSSIYRDMGRLPDALENQLKAIGIYEKVLGADHPSLATSYNNVSTIYFAMGRLPDALEHQLKAIAIVEKVLGADHPHLASAYNNVSTIYSAMGRLPDALENQLKAIGILEQVLGADHPDLATSYNNVSTIYFAMGRLPDALENQLKAIAIREKVLGADHPDRAQSYNNVSLIYSDMGRLADALEYQLKAIAIREQVLGADHPDLATSYHNLSLIYDESDREKEALTYARRAVAILEKLFPNGHPNLDIMRKNLDRLSSQ